MPKFLLQANYVGEGIKGLLKEGGTSRMAAATQAVEALGGKLEAFYYAFGDTDAYVIAEMPDNATMAAAALNIAASGRVTLKTTVLLTPAEVDHAGKKTLNYRPPGQ